MMDSIQIQVERWVKCRMVNASSVLQDFVVLGQKIASE